MAYLGWISPIELYITRFTLLCFHWALILSTQTRLSCCRNGNKHAFVESLENTTTYWHGSRDWCF